MNYREVFLLSEETLGSSGTKTIDINVTEPITEILVNYKHKNSTSAVDDTPAQEGITKIEVVDGGQVYFSLTGPEAVGVAAYDLGRYPGCWMNESANQNQRVFIPIRFGRHLGDEEYGLSPRAFLNPQVKVTWSNPSGIDADNTTLEVMATVMQDVADPGKAIFTKQIEAWSTAAEGVHDVDLPVDYPYRRLFARTYEDSVWIGTQWSAFVLDCDVGKLIVFDWEDVHFLRYCQARFPTFRVTGFVAATNNEMKQTRLGQVDGGFLVKTDSAAHIYGCIPTAPHYIRLYAVDTAGAPQTDDAAKLDVWGYLPENMYCYEFGDKGKSETWFNAPGYKGIKLKITEGNAGGTASVLLQQPRSIP